jgi:hypothetical protein
MFRGMITPWIIRIIYPLGVIGITLTAIRVWVYAGSGPYQSVFGYTTYPDQGTLVLYGFLILIFGNIYWRIVCELMIILFRIYQTLRDGFRAATFGGWERTMAEGAIPAPLPAPQGAGDGALASQSATQPMPVGGAPHPSQAQQNIEFGTGLADQGSSGPAVTQPRSTFMSGVGIAWVSHLSQTVGTGQPVRLIVSRLDGNGQPEAELLNEEVKLYHPSVDTLTSDLTRADLQALDMLRPGNYAVRYMLGQNPLAHGKFSIVPTS